MNYDYLEEDELEKKYSDDNEKALLNPQNQDTNLIFANITNISYKEKKLSQLYLISLIYFLFVVLEIIGGYYSN